MKEKIKELCKNIEEKNKVKILFAIENGSRAWRMESEDSDYDVKFVFIRKIEEYIKIKKPEEVIEAKFDKEGNTVEAKGAYIDMSGFDIIKYATMLSTSNPTAIEWLISDIVYDGKQNELFKDYAIKNFEILTLYHHYKSMCRNNYIKYLKTGGNATYKKYLYAFRGLVNAKWVLKKRSLPPIIFLDTVKGMQEELPAYITQKIEEMIKIKKSGKEKEKIENIAKVDSYIESFLKKEDELPSKKNNVNVDELNKEIRRIITQ